MYFHIRIFLLLLMIGCFGHVVLGFDHTDNDRVLVVYNNSFTTDGDADGVQDSLQLATYYADFRSIPTNHIMAVSTSTGYYYGNHEDFYNELVLPIRNKLTEIGTTNVDVILLMYGIPYRTRGSSGNICVDNCLMSLGYISSETNLSWKTNPYLETAPMFYTDKGHFDHSLYNYLGTDMYLVCRLSAPDEPWGVINQLEQIRYAEKYIATNQYMGVSYVDSRYADYTDEQLSNDTDVIYGRYWEYDEGDKNMAYAEHYILDHELPLGWEKTGNEIGEAAATIHYATNAILYGGWYNYGRYLDVFDWLPGSVGCDLNSNSASGMRNGNAWCGGAFRNGLSCGAGVIGEPYMSGHQRPNILIYYLLKGYTFAEASALATPSIQWQDVNLGDPLYAPFRFKTVVPDITPPVISTGYPYFVSAAQTEAIICYKIDRSDCEPEVAKCVVHYGLTPECLETNTANYGYWLRGTAVVTGLHSGSPYYYYLTLRDLAGNSTNSDIGIFETANAAPMAEFSMDPSTGTVPFTVTFDGRISLDDDGTVEQWSWDFGDGHTGVGPIVEHTYTNYGFIKASLCVTDDDSDTGAVTNILQVEPPDAVMVVYQQGRDNYTNMIDSYISRYSNNDSNKNYGAATTCRSYSTNSRRSLIQFDLSAIPTNAIIEYSELRLMISAKSYGSVSYDWAAYRITNQWIEGDGNGATADVGVTWMDYDRGSPWHTPGGDYDKVPVAGINYGDIHIGEWAALDTTEVVSNWVCQSMPNYGVLMKTTAGNAVIDFNSSEHETVSQRPMLIIVYSMPETCYINVHKHDHGNVSPDGVIGVTTGGDILFTIDAAPYFYITSIMTNNTHISGSPFIPETVTNAVLNYTNILENGSLSVVFDPYVTSNQTPQWWLVEHGWTDEYETVSWEDSDGDGVSNWEEYLCDTDPTNSSSILRMQTMFSSGNGLEVGWRGGDSFVSIS